MARSFPVPIRRWRRRGWGDALIWIIRIAAILVIAWGISGTVAQSVNGEGPTGEAWRDLVVAGVAQGALYGLIALGYSMVYGVLRFINFAHGEVFMSGAMVGFFVADHLWEIRLWETNFILAILMVLASSILTSALVAMLVERVAYRPLRGSPRMIPLITSIGIAFFLQYTFAGLFGVAVKSYPPPPDSLRSRVEFLGFEVEGTKLAVMGVALVAMVGLYLFVERTRTGRAIRAVAEDSEMAALMGIDVDRTIVTTFAVGGALAGVAGTLWALLFRGVSFITGFLPGIKAFTAAVLGGIGNLGGAMAGGLLLGLFEGVGPQLVLGGFGVPAVSQLKDVVAFTALVLVLVFKPTGLFGERLSDEDRA
ncbi:MAG: branched-chain amino acid ABC transporter permease [bacterium]|nr:branched-chain amino acid ABC transporter permease [bacterium]MDE0288571.1 branched-chain amino acid ABC transporter permease [bacterium]MDE0437740.1 branched-chain amino acid ABC transporter permease [bacterium]